MSGLPLGRKLTDPWYANNFLDSCAFDPKYFPEDEAADRIRRLGANGTIHLIVARSISKELDHPNTPSDVKSEAMDMLHSLETGLTNEERQRFDQIHTILTGMADPEKYRADAAHVFEAGKYVGYFTTDDARILKRRERIRGVKGSTPVIVRPTEWISIFDNFERS